MGPPKRIGLAVASLSAAALSFGVLAGCESEHATVSRQFDATLAATGLTTLLIQGYNGDINATAGSGNVIVVHARLRTRRVQSILQDTVTLSRRGSEAFVTSQCPSVFIGLWNVQDCEVTYDVVFPRTMSATFSIVNGDVTVAGSSSSVVARTTNGDVSVRQNSGDVTEESHQGDVSTTLDAGWSGRAVSMQTRFGDVDLLVPNGFRATMVIRKPFAGDVTGASEVASGSAVVSAATTFGDIEVSRDGR